MPRQKTYHTRTLYFSDKLKESMHSLIDFPCTVVEAPIGYGKTTAVKEALPDLGVTTLWQSVYESSTTDFWLGFCHAFGELDPALALNLLAIGIPENSVLMREVVHLLRAAPILEHTLLIIDDYHMIKSVEIDGFLAFLIQHLPPKLHLVILTRLAFLRENAELQLKGLINHIGVKTLEFEPSDIAKYYKLCGINISQEEQSLLYSNSEGWISALYLFMLDYTKQGHFTTTLEIPELVRYAVFIPLEEELKVFLIHICLFESFSLQQAQQMCPHLHAQELLSRLLSLNAFIVQDRATRHYHLHNIFSTCVREEFAKEPECFQNEQWRKAGQWHMENAEYMAAMKCFFKAKDFDSMLESIDADHVNGIHDEHKKYLKLYVEQCPAGIRAKHHFAMLVYIRRLYMLNEIELFFKTSAEILNNLQADLLLDAAERDRLMGEYELVMGFTKYNQILKMSQHHQAACKLLKAPSSLLKNGLDWTFAAPSVLYMFYRESGKLSEHVAVMKEAMPYYYRVTGGHGMGAETVMEAEAYFLRGDWDSAQIHAHTAIDSARSKQQWSILLCAVFLLARIAVAKGDYKKADSLLFNLREELTTHRRYLLFHTLDACDSYIHCLLGRTSRIADWMASGTLSTNKMSFPAVPAIQMIYGRVLLDQGDYVKLIGQSQQFLQLANVFPNLLSVIYIHIHCAAAYAKINKRMEAIEHMKQALDIAMPDCIYLPFVENGAYLKDMLAASDFGSAYSEMLSKCRSLYKAYDENLAPLRAEQKASGPALTEREQEVAALAAAGHSNKEISQQLFISENTVKARLKSIFEKLSIKSRAQLEALVLPPS